jgi:hypothetical protein
MSVGVTTDQKQTNFNLTYIIKSRLSIISIQFSHFGIVNIKIFKLFIIHSAVLSRNNIRIR